MTKVHVSINLTFKTDYFNKMLYRNPKIYYLPKAFINKDTVKSPA